MVGIVIGLSGEGSMTVGGMKIGGVVLMITGGMKDAGGMETGEREGLETGERGGLETGERGGLETGEREGLETGEREGLETGERGDMQTGEREGMDMMMVQGDTDHLRMVLRSDHASNCSLVPSLLPKLQILRVQMVGAPVPYLEGLAQ